jgi:hypothetical protein
MAAMQYFPLVIGLHKANKIQLQLDHIAMKSLLSAGRICGWLLYFHSAGAGKSSYFHIKIYRGIMIF